MRSDEFSVFYGKCFIFGKNISLDMRVTSCIFLIFNLLTHVSVKAQTYDYLALGDSYTIGEAVEEQKRYPIQLADFLGYTTKKQWQTTIIAKTGWTTDELIAAIEDANLEGKTFALVSLLIGVNNQYRNYSIEQYKIEFKSLLEQAIAFAGGDKNRVFVVSIPDYGVTPFAKERNPVLIAEEIDRYNQINKLITEEMGVSYFDITPISRQASENLSLIAEDNLHPSAEMYRLWVESFKNQILEKVTSN